MKFCGKFYSINYLLHKKCSNSRDDDIDLCERSALSVSMKSLMIMNLSFGASFTESSIT